MLVWSIVVIIARFHLGYVLPKDETKHEEMIDILEEYMSHQK